MSKMHILMPVLYDYNKCICIKSTTSAAALGVATHVEKGLIAHQKSTEYVEFVGPAQILDARAFVHQHLGFRKHAGPGIIAAVEDVGGLASHLFLEYRRQHRPHAVQVLGSQHVLLKGGKQAVDGLLTLTLMPDEGLLVLGATAGNTNE